MSAEAARAVVAIIRATDWSQLSHAYGRAEDTPRHLAALALSGDLEAAEADWSADLEAADDDVMNAVYARALLASRRVCPRLLDAVAPFMDDPLPAVRIHAVNGVAKLCRQPDLHARRASLGAAIEQAAWAAAAQERAMLVLSLGELGADTSAFLDDPSQVVRCCAALAPAQADNPAATREILAALEDPSAADHWLPRETPQIDGWLRFTLLREAIRRTPPFEVLLPAALAVVRGTAHLMTVDLDWGPRRVPPAPRTMGQLRRDRWPYTEPLRPDAGRNRDRARRPAGYTQAPFCPWLSRLGAAYPEEGHASPWLCHPPPRRRPRLPAPLARPARPAVALVSSAAADASSPRAARCAPSASTRSKRSTTKI